jgi:WD40 repeat protein
MSEQTDHITDMVYLPRKHCLLVTSGDGTLAMYDPRKGKIKGKSPADEDELLSVAVVKGGKKVVTGTQAGVLELWNWGELAGCSDACVSPWSLSSCSLADPYQLLASACRAAHFRTRVCS